MDDLQQAHNYSYRDFRPEGSSATQLPYLLYLPPDYHSNIGQRWPLVLFLHGSEERGNGGANLEIVTKHGPPMLVKQGIHFPFILVSPQCPADDVWGIHINGLIGLLDELEQTYSIDRDRMIVTGCSMGGFGTWSLALAQPQRFSALVPICGGGESDKACSLKHIAIWAFHGAKDPYVPVQFSEEMVTPLKKCGGNIRLTIYPEGEHTIWIETYNDPQLYTWMLAQKRIESSTEG